MGGGEAEGELAEGGSGVETPSSPSEIPDDEAEVFSIEYAKEGGRSVTQNQTLLEAGEDQGWDMPYACRQGQVSRVAATSPTAPPRTTWSTTTSRCSKPRSSRTATRLTCVGYPKSDFTLETRETP